MTSLGIFCAYILSYIVLNFNVRVYASQITANCFYQLFFCPLDGVTQSTLKRGDVPTLEFRNDTNVLGRLSCPFKYISVYIKCFLFYNPRLKTSLWYYFFYFANLLLIHIDSEQNIL